MSFENIKNFVADDLKQVDNIIIACCHGRHPLLVEIAEHIVAAGGKRLRAILTILSARLFGYSGNVHHYLAASVEAIHTATLLHDDVVDSSSMRRGRATANSIWDNKASILVGDFLFSNAFQLMVVSESIEVLKALASASSIIAEGEVMQLSASFNFDLEYDDYIKIISAKTAELFAVSTYIGAVISSQNQEYQNLMREFGLNLGIAFQIIDDVLDYTAKGDDFGKNLGDDLKEGKITIPLILARDDATMLEKEQLRDILKGEITDKEMQFTMDIMHKYNSINHAKEIVAKYLNRCQEIIQKLPQNEVAKNLQNIIDFSMERVF